MSMNELLAQHYGTGAGSEDLEKQAQAELFAKLAASNGIDLDLLNNDQIEHLWNETFSKTAEEDEDEDKKEQAEKEHEKKKESMAKVAEADFLGRMMAHAMVNELTKIAEEEDGEEKLALKRPKPGSIDKAKGWAESAGKAVSEAWTGKKSLRQSNQAARFLKARKGGASDTDLKEMARAHLGDKLKDKKSLKAFNSMGGKDLANAAKDTRAHHRRVDTARTIGKGLGAAGLGAGAALGIHHATKESSALDELAAEQAVIKAAEVGWDIDEAADRVASVYTLGLGESEKVASAEDVDSAIDVRAVEFLEAAGYPVNWE